MELKDYGRLLRRHWMIIVVCTLSGLLGSAALSLIVKPEYVSQTQLFVAIQGSGSVAELQQGNSFTQARVQSYVETVRTPAVLQPVIDGLGLEVTPAQLAEQVRANADLRTVLIRISVTDSSPVQAAAIAQGVAESLIDTVDVLEGSDMGLPSPVKLSIVTPAAAPSSPDSPNIPRNLALGLALGLVIGFGGAVIRSAMDSRVRNEFDLVQITDAPILGGVAYDQDASKKPLLTQAPAQSPRAESFRQIRTNFQFASVNSRSRTVLITSSLPGEGKTTTATNIAIALAQAGQRVALVDADLRRPMVATYLGLEGSAGLTTALVGAADVEHLLQPWGENHLSVLTSGQIPPNPSELLGSEAMETLLRKLEASFDVVVIDAPPLIPVTDSSVLAQLAGGVVLIAGSGKIKTQDLDRSLAALELVGAKTLGIVLNLLPTKGPDAYAYTYYSYDSKQAQSPPNKRTRRPGLKR